MTSKSLKGLLCATILLLAASAFAEKASLQLYDSVTVGGKQLQAGDYTVQWDGSGPNVQVNILRGKAKVVATVPARVVDVKEELSTNSYSLTTNPDGSKSLSQIQFHGKKFALAIGGDAGAAVAGNNSQ